MVTLQDVQEQLKKSGSDFRLWGRGEVKELSKILADGEEIHRCTNGHYVGGFAMLVATDRRLLLVDRKPMYLTIEAIWYDKIGQVDYSHRLLNATVCISTPNKDLTFTSWNHSSLREIMLYSQEKMIEARSEPERAAGRPQPARRDYREPPVAAVERPETVPNFGVAQAAPAPEPAAEQLTAQDFPRQQFNFDSAVLAQMPRAHRRLRFPIALPDELTLYTATRLPFSRRRRFADYAARY